MDYKELSEIIKKKSDLLEVVLNNTKETFQLLKATSRFLVKYCSF